MGLSLADWYIFLDCLGKQKMEDSIVEAYLLRCSVLGTVESFNAMIEYLRGKSPEELKSANQTQPSSSLKTYKREGGW